MFSALLFLVAAITGGTASTYFYDEDGDLFARLSAGVPLGVAGVGFIGAPLCSRFGLNLVGIAITGFLLFAPALFLANSDRKRQVLADLAAARDTVVEAVRSPFVKKAGTGLLFLFFGIVLWLVFTKVFWLRNSALFSTSENFGDLPFHLSVICRFLYGHAIPPDDPTFAGARLTYPYFADFVIAMLVRAGASLQQALFFEGIVLSLSLFGLIWRFCLELTGSAVAARLGPLLFFLNGGLGWLLLFSDQQKSRTGILGLLLNLPHGYTDVQPGAFFFGNSISTLLTTERSILLGLPLALVILTQLWIVSRSLGSGVLVCC